MFRLLGYALLLAALVAGAVWLADHPGQVQIEWLDWRLETSVPVLLAALLILAGGLFYGIRTTHLLLTWPRRVVARRRLARTERGYQALSDGLAMVAGGQGDKARKLARKAEKLLKNPRLTSVLVAQSAQLNGEQETLKDHYERLLERPETTLLGLRGLLDLALKSGRSTEAIDLAVKARKLAPGDKTLAEQLFPLLVKAERFDEAQDLLTHAARFKAMDRDVVNRRRALLANERSSDAELADNGKDAVEFAKLALGHDPALVDAALRLARLQAVQGLTRQAANTLERSWRAIPHPLLSAAYASLIPNQPPLQQLRRLEKLASHHPNGWQTDLMMGEAALAAKLWGQARQHLTRAAKRPTPKLLGLLAKLEMGEYQNQRAAQNWLDASPSPEPDWVCRSCGHHAEQWSLFCRQCDTLDSMRWQDEPKPKLSEAKAP